jgi:molybdopterin-containing oxidoreductase family membrane subunit
MLATIFFMICELFTVYYSQIPEHTHHFTYLFAGLHGHAELVPSMWTFAIMAVVATIMLLIPSVRNNDKLLPIACVLVFFSLWIEKGVSLVVGGFIPSPMETITPYIPTCPEVMITIAIWAIGLLMITLLYKIAISLKKSL